MFVRPRAGSNVRGMCGSIVREFRAFVFLCEIVADRS